MKTQIELNVEVTFTNICGAVIAGAGLLLFLTSCKENAVPVILAGTSLIGIKKIGDMFGNTGTQQ